MGADEEELKRLRQQYSEMIDERERKCKSGEIPYVEKPSKFYWLEEIELYGKIRKLRRKIEKKDSQDGFIVCNECGYMFDFNRWLAKGDWAVGAYLSKCLEHQGIKSSGTITLRSFDREEGYTVTGEVEKLLNQKEEVWR